MTEPRKLRLLLSVVLVVFGLIGLVLPWRTYRDLRKQSVLMQQFTREVTQKESGNDSLAKSLSDLQRATDGQAEVASSKSVRLSCITSVILGLVTLTSGIGLLSGKGFFLKLAVTCTATGLLWGIYTHRVKEELRPVLREQVRTFYTAVEQVTGVELNWEERRGWKQADRHPGAALVGSAFAFLIQVGVLVGLIHIWRVQSRSDGVREGTESKGHV
jgi:hypothetical protein